jgi:voltage-gated potassium channel
LHDDVTQPLPAVHAIVAGFGVPGRHCADWLARHGRSFVVIERNAQTVDRCSRTGVPIIEGDATDEAVLRAAGMEQADLLAVAIPDEAVALAVVAAGRRLNPRARILARVYHVSIALEALKQGGDDAIVAEELAAREFVRLLEGGRGAFHSHDGHPVVHAAVGIPPAARSPPNG